MLKEIVNTVALQGDRFVEFADCSHVAIRHQGRLVVEIESCAGFDGELVAHSKRVVDKIGFGGSKGELILDSQSGRGFNEIDILSYGFEVDGLRILVDCKAQVIFDKNGCVFLVRVNIDLDENEEAVTSVELDILELREVVFSVHIDFEGGVVIEPYIADSQCVGIAVIDHQAQCGCADRGKDRVKRDGVLREGES